MISSVGVLLGWSKGVGGFGNPLLASPRRPLLGYQADEAPKAPPCDRYAWKSAPSKQTVKSFEIHPRAWLWWAGRRHGTTAGLAEIGFEGACLLCPVHVTAESKKCSEELF
jgi:hypothetical protein